MYDTYQDPLILVVDDEPLIRMLAVDLARDAHCAALEASNAAEALSLLETRSDIRLVLTDIDMPGGMDGVELARTIMERWPQVRVVIASGSGRLARRQSLPDTIRVFPKPYACNEMVSHLQSMVS